MNDAKQFGRLVWTLIATAVVLQAVIFAYAFQAAADGRTNIAEIDHFIYCSLDRSERTLPTIDYYREHPDELEEQLELVREQKMEFTPPPEPCVP